ncbi:unnamed protein product [Durusdinium trenchii]|uniref:Uncharacterized protein n=1 Tax=Durusdinium trenchii TaxID=1381693 RepID=A0ABP0KIJ5_9DINO
MLTCFVYAAFQPLPGVWPTRNLSPGKRLRSIARSAKKTKPEDKVQQVEEYLKRIGGSAKLKALKSVLRGISSDFLQKHFEVTSDGFVKSKQGHNKQEANIKEFLASRGIVPLALLLQTFRVSRRWLETHKDFFVKDEMVKLRIRPTIQPEACRECRHQLGFNLEHSQTSKRVAQSLSVQVGPKNCEKVTRERCVASIASLCGVGGTVWEVQEESRALCKCVWDSLHSSQELTCQLRRGNRTRKGDKRCPGKNRKCQNTGDV